MRFVRDGELQGLKQGGQLLPYGSLYGAHRPERLIGHSSVSSPKYVVNAACLTQTKHQLSTERLSEGGY